MVKSVFCRQNFSALFQQQRFLVFVVLQKRQLSMLSAMILIELVTELFISKILEVSKEKEETEDQEYVVENTKSCTNLFEVNVKHEEASDFEETTEQKEVIWK